MSDPAKLLGQTDVELCERYSQVCYAEDELHSEKTMIRQELEARLLDRKEDSTIADNKYTVTRFQRIGFKTSLAEARELGAVKVEEKPDTTKLRTLYEAGVTVPGMSQTWDVKITEIKVQE